jgi:hypothetical protein
MPFNLDICPFCKEDLLIFPKESQIQELKGKGSFECYSVSCKYFFLVKFGMHSENYPSYIRFFFQGDNLDSEFLVSYRYFSDDSYVLKVFESPLKNTENPLKQILHIDSVSLPDFSDGPAIVEKIRFMLNFC